MSLRDMVEAHTHSHMMPYEGLQSMAAQGITRAVSCAIVVMARYAESYFDHFNAMRSFYVSLASSAGVKMYSALGVHPAGIPEDWPRVIKYLEELLQEDDVVAVGEIGMNQGSDTEKEAFRAQLKVARDQNVPAIVHTPKNNREYIVDTMLDIASEVGMPGAKLVIDHAHLDIIGKIDDYGAVPGLTIREANLTPFQLVENIDSFKHGILNSDYSNIAVNNPVGMVDAVDRMMASGISPDIVASMARDRAAALYGI